MLNKQRQNGGFLSALEDTPSVIGRWDFSAIGVTLSGIKQRFTNAAESGDIVDFQRCFIYLFLKKESSVGDDCQLYGTLLKEAQVCMQRTGLVDKLAKCFGPPIDAYEDVELDELINGDVITFFNAPISQISVENAVEGKLKSIGFMLTSKYWVIKRDIRLSLDGGPAFCASCFGGKEGRPLDLLTFIQCQQPSDLESSVAYCHEVGHALHMHNSSIVNHDFMVAETAAHTFMFLLMDAVAEKAAVGNPDEFVVNVVKSRLSSFVGEDHLKHGAIVALYTGRAIAKRLREQTFGYDRFFSVVGLDGMDYTTMIKMLDLKEVEQYNG